MSGTRSPTHQLAIVFALARESAPFLATLQGRGRLRAAPCRAWTGRCRDRDVLVVETGPGAAATETALHWLLRARPRAVVAAGFAGALQAPLQVGDCLLVRDVVEASGGGWQASWRPDGPSAASTLFEGRLLTLPRIAATPEEKQALGQQHGALAVDMETATVARCCAAVGVPWSGLRAISDDAQSSLPPQLCQMLAHGRASLPRVGWLVCRQPGLLPELWQLARATQHAARQLAERIAELVRQDSPVPLPPAAERG